MMATYPEGYLAPFSLPGQTQNAGTVIRTLVPPPSSHRSPPLVYKKFNNRPNWLAAGRTHLTSLIYTSAATAHTVTLLRPCNYTYFNGAVAKNSTTFIISDDPGVYSTNYKYPMPQGATVEANVADNAIAGSDLVAYQLIDGTWVVDLVSSLSGLTLTMTTATPNITGGGIADGQVLFFFGIVGDTDPATGLAHAKCVTTASTTNVDLLNGITGAGFSALHPGDPMLIISNNASNAGTLVSAGGYFSRF